MRQLILVLTVAAASAPTVANADRDDRFLEVDDWDRRNMLLVNPGDLFNGTISLEYERGVARWFGITLGLSVASFRGVFQSDDEPYFTAIAPELGFRFHFIKDAPRGLWVGPYVSPGLVIAREGRDPDRAWSWGLGAALGYNFTVGRNFTFQLGVGGGFTDYGERIRWDPRLKLGIGATF